MWTLEILLSMVALIALVASESDPDSYAARRTQVTVEIKCEYHEQLMNRTCDGTCEDPAPSCLFQDPEENGRSALRCSCPIGEVRDGEYCQPIWRCNPRPIDLTQCQLEEKFDTLSRITCDESGLFTSKQSGPFVDRCVHTRTGQTVPGKMADHGSFLDCSDLTACQKNWLEENDLLYDNPFAVDFYIDGCAEDGHFENSMCNPLIPGCICRVRQTGNIIPGPRVRHCNPENYTPCQLAFVAAELTRFQSNSAHVVYPKCSNIDGSYPQKMCDGYYDCYCQDRLTGKRLPGSGVAMNCDELTACQTQRFERSASSWRACDSDGRFATKQCHISGKCKCVDADTGRRVEGTGKVPVDQVETLLCPEATCPSNMVYSTCTGCEVTCENKYARPKVCTEMCQSRCTCPDHLVWHGFVGKCVPTEDCPSRKELPLPPVRLQDSLEYRPVRNGKPLRSG